MRRRLRHPGSWPALVEVGFLAAVLPVYLRLTPWPRVMRLARGWGDPTSGGVSADAALRFLEWLLRRRGARRWLTCLPTALLRYRYLRRLGEPAVVHLGIQREAPPGTASRRTGHAWVTIAGRPYGEPEEALAGQVETLRLEPQERLPLREQRC